MEKVFEYPLKESLSAVRKNIGKRIVLLNKKYQKLKRKFNVVYSWDEEIDTLQISNEQYQINVYIHFTKGVVAGYVEVPFLLRAVAWIYKDAIVKEVIMELDSFLESLKK